jgi:hypothetical protein
LATFASLLHPAYEPGDGFKSIGVTKDWPRFPVAWEENLFWIVSNQ